MRQEEAVRVDVGDEGVEERGRVREEAVRVEGLVGGGGGGGGEEGGEEGEGAGLGGGEEGVGLGVWAGVGAWLWWTGKCREGGVSGGLAEGEEGCCSWGAEGAHFEGKKRCAGGMGDGGGGLEVVTWKWWGSRCRTRALGAIVLVGALWECLRVVVVRNKTFHVDDRGFDGGFAEVGGSVRYGLQVRYSGMVRVTRVTLSGTCRMNQLRFADFRSFCWTPFFLPRESSSCLTLQSTNGQISLQSPQP